MKEIGSFFPIYHCRDYVGSLRDSTADKQFRHYSLCREALLEIARHYKTHSKRVIFPAFTCRSVVDPFIQEGWECRYYNVSTDLRIKAEYIVSLSESFKPDVCIVHPYFGTGLTKDELQTLALVKGRCGCLMVEDKTQCLFSSFAYEVFDVIVGSYRKWFPIPDGGFLRLVRPVLDLELPKLDYSDNEPFASLMYDAMYLRGVFLQSGDEEIKAISRRMSSMSLSKINGAIEPHKMSGLSLKMMYDTDWVDIQKKRSDNYGILHEGLKSGCHLKFVKESVTEIKSAPLFFPVYVQERDQFQEALSREKIYATALWQSSASPEMVSDPDVEYIFNHILAIPCDQRYDRDDMERVVDVIEKLNE